MRECFVIMPFSKTTCEHGEQYWTEFFEEFLTPALAECGYRARRSQDTPGNIAARIICDLVTCELVLAVLTDSNANVFYELGVRHASRRGTVMVLEEGYGRPFDVAGYGIIPYERQKLAEFTRRLKTHVEGLANGEPDNPISDKFDMDLVYALNISRSRLREVVELLCEPRTILDPEGVRAHVCKTADSWPAREQVSIVDPKDKIVYHKDEKLIGVDAKQGWSDAGRGGESLFPLMRDNKRGIIVHQAMRRKGRLTAMSYETRDDEWIVIVEAHYFHEGRRPY